MTLLKTDSRFEKKWDESDKVINEITSELEVIKDLYPLDIPYKHAMMHTKMEARRLYEIAFGLYDTDDLEGNIVQCGTYYGGSAAVLGKSVIDRGKSEFVFTIDNFIKAYPKNSLPAHKLLFDNLKLNKHTLSIISVICDDISYISNFVHFPIRIAVLDSAHNEEHVTNQLNLCFPKVMDNGWILVHDYGNIKPEWPGVTQAVDGWLNRNAYKCEAFCLHRYAVIKKSRSNQ